MLYQVFLTSEFVDEILMCGHLNGLKAREEGSTMYFLPLYIFMLYTCIYTRCFQFLSLWMKF